MTALVLGGEKGWFWDGLELADGNKDEEVSGSYKGDSSDDSAREEEASVAVSCIVVGSASREVVKGGFFGVPGAMLSESVPYGVEVLVVLAKLDLGVHGDAGPTVPPATTSETVFTMLPALAP